MENIIKSKIDALTTDDLEYKADVFEQFEHIPDVAKPILNKAKKTFDKIEKELYKAPAVIELIKSAVPEETLQAVFTDEQREQLAKGALKLLTKKDGNLAATLIDPKTKKMVANVSLKQVKKTPEMAQSMNSFSMQMQMAQIAEQIQSVQLAVEEVRMGQEYDRLATAYSCQQKFLQAIELKNPTLKEMALMQLVSDAEDSRNLLMLSQKSNVEFIKSQPEDFFGILLASATTEKIDGRMNEIRESLYAINMTSLVEAMAYNELGENEAARKCLSYYAGFIDSTYILEPGLVDRLDQIDSSPDNYWSTTLPVISKNISALPCFERVELIEEKMED